MTEEQEKLARFFYERYKKGGSDQHALVYRFDFSTNDAISKVKQFLEINKLNKSLHAYIFAIKKKKNSDCGYFRSNGVNTFGITDKAIAYFEEKDREFQKSFWQKLTTGEKVSNIIATGALLVAIIASIISYLALIKTK